MIPPSTLVSRETESKLRRYAELLLEWNKTINLIGDPEKLWQRHIEDALQLLPLLPSLDLTLADLGSGAGLPGIVLAICGIREVHLVERDQRKCAFLREASRITHTPVTIHPTAIETVSLPPCDVITARALAPLESLLALAEPHLQPYSFCLFPKGRNWYKEEIAARAQWRFDLISHPSALDAESAILAITHLQKASA